jgi:hypothetical protein
MLEDFLRKQEIVIILLQEVMQPILDTIRVYSAYTNKQAILHPSRSALRPKQLPTQWVFPRG